MDEPQRIREIAESNFKNGLLCAESVVSALANHQGVDHPLIPKMATAFCSGMGRTCGTCGALTGAIMGISIGLGRDSKDDSVNSSYHATQALINAFVNEFGAKNCDQLLGCDIGTPEGQAIFKSQNLSKNCSEYTGRATEIAVQILTKNAR